MQAVSDKALGGLMLLVASSVFTYYTTWAMLLVRHPVSYRLFVFDLDLLAVL
jgi:dolichyl-phosphate mannosyltransferase polypeptide 2 regulatory subunit